MYNQKQTRYKITDLPEETIGYKITDLPEETIPIIANLIVNEEDGNQDLKNFMRSAKKFYKRAQNVLARHTVPLHLRLNDENSFGSFMLAVERNPILHAYVETLIIEGDHSSSDIDKISSLLVTHGPFRNLKRLTLSGINNFDFFFCSQCSKLKYVAFENGSTFVRHDPIKPLPSVTRIVCNPSDRNTSWSLDQLIYLSKCLPNVKQIQYTGPSPFIGLSFSRNFPDNLFDPDDPDNFFNIIDDLKHLLVWTMKIDLVLADNSKILVGHLSILLADDNVHLADDNVHEIQNFIDLVHSKFPTPIDWNHPDDLLATLTSDLRNHENIFIIKGILELHHHTPEPRRYLIFQAMMNNNIQLVRTFLELGGKIPPGYEEDVQIMLNDENGSETVLLHAIENNDVDLADSLVRNGVHLHPGTHITLSNLHDISHPLARRIVEGLRGSVNNIMEAILQLLDNNYRAINTEFMETLANENDRDEYMDDFAMILYDLVHMLTEYERSQVLRNVFIHYPEYDIDSILHAIDMCYYNNNNGTFDDDAFARVIFRAELRFANDAVKDEVNRYLMENDKNSIINHLRRWI